MDSADLDKSLECENSDEEVINPCPPEWLDNEDNALLRGDAIGDTVYTHRWILKCLFTITEGLPKYLRQKNTGKTDMNNGEFQNENKDEETTNGDSDSQNLNEKEDHSVSSVNECMEEFKIVELDTEIEDAACQLWDMTVEKEVSIHLLSLQEIDIFQLAALIFEDSCAPRLTEVMVGVIANLCCEEEACNKIFQKEEYQILLSTIQIIGSTSDVPTLCEVMRLLRLLLWHRTNRTPNTSWAGCPLLKLLCQERYRNAISFLISNSLSDTLIASVLELLSTFLFICLPETGLNVASFYSTEDIIKGLIDVLERKNSALKRNHDDDDKILHLVILCLYAFIDTPGARLIQSSSSGQDSRLESILQSYLEHEGRVESPGELIGDASDRITRVVGLSQLLIPSMKLPTAIMTVGKLMALINGETHQYSVSRSHSREDQSDDEDLDSKSEFKSRKKKKKGKKHNDKIDDQKQPFSNPLIEECGWVSPPAETVVQPPDDGGKSSARGTLSFELPAFNYKHKENSSSSDDEIYRRRSISVSSLNTWSSLKELQELLEDYCYHLLAYWWSHSKEVNAERRLEAQKVILGTLDQCHAHEVLFILKAVRTRDQSLVPRLQEQILDLGTHQRLVALLAHMYQ